MRQKQKRAVTGGIRSNDPPRDDPTRPLVARPIGSAGKRGELHGYDGPMAFSDADPDCTTPTSGGPTVITVKGVPPEDRSRCHY